MGKDSDQCVHPCVCNRHVSVRVQQCVCVPECFWGQTLKLRFPAQALFTPLKMQMLVINPAFAHLFGGTAPCFIKPIYHSGLLNQWDAEESSVSTEARRENTSSLYTSEERGALKQEQIKVSVTHCECVVTEVSFLCGLILKNTLIPYGIHAPSTLVKKCSLYAAHSEEEKVSVCK